MYHSTDSLHVLPVSAWISLSSSFLPQSKIMSDYLVIKLTVGVGVSVNPCYGRMHVMEG